MKAPFCETLFHNVDTHLKLTTNFGLFNITEECDIDLFRIFILKE